jgi:hypothetical protein
VGIGIGWMMRVGVSHTGLVLGIGFLELGMESLSNQLFGLLNAW